MNQTNGYLHLFCFLLERLLVYSQLFSHLRTWLPCQDVFQLQVEFLFLLDQKFLLDNLLCLGDESFLQCVDFLDLFVGAWVTSLKDGNQQIYEKSFNAICVYLPSGDVKFYASFLYANKMCLWNIDAPGSNKVNISPTLWLHPIFRGLWCQWSVSNP